MSTLVESLRRLYTSNPPKVTLEKLQSMVDEGKISQEAFNYITG